MTTGPAIPKPLPPRIRTSGAYKWTALGVVSLGSLMSTMDQTILNISFPALASTFQVDPSVIAWVSIAYLLTTTGLLLTMGWVGDALGRERIFILGLMVHTVVLALAALAQNIQQLIALRAVQGIGVAMILSSVSAILAAAFPARERGMAFGLLGAIVGIGLSAGPPLGGAILDVLDWRALFYTRVPLGVTAVLLSWLFLERAARVPGPLHLDTAGSLLLVALLGSFLLAMNQAGRLGITSLLVVTTGLLSAALLPVFVWRERRARRPILDLRLLRIPAFSVGLEALLTHYQAWSAVSFLMPFIMINGLGIGASQAGLMLSVFSVTRLFGSPISGWLSDRIGHRLLMGLGLGIMAIAMVGLSRLDANATSLQIVGLMALASLAPALFEAPTSSSIMGAVPATRLGMAAASIAAGRADRHGNRHGPLWGYPGSPPGPLSGHRLRPGSDGPDTGHQRCAGSQCRHLRPGDSSGSPGQRQQPSVAGSS